MNVGSGILILRNRIFWNKDYNYHMLLARLQVLARNCKVNKIVPKL